MLPPFILHENVSVVRRGKEVIVPLVIATYNNMMGGVVQSDQMMNSYPVERKTFKKWCKTCGFMLSVFVYSMLIYYIKKVANCIPRHRRQKNFHIKCFIFSFY